MFIHAASGEFGVNACQTANPANRRALEFINSGGVINGYVNCGIIRPQYIGGRVSSGNYVANSNETINNNFSHIPESGMPLKKQVFSAVRRLKSRQKVRRKTCKFREYEKIALFGVS